MGKCPNCGNEEFLLMKDNCVVCGKEGCYKCVNMPLFWFHSKYTTMHAAVVCSESCWNNFLKEIIAIFDKNISVSPSDTVDGRYITEVLKFAYLSYVQENPDFPRKKDVKRWLKDDKLDFRWLFDDKTYKGCEPPYKRYSLSTEHYIGINDPRQSSYHLFYELCKHLLLDQKRNRKNLLLNKARHYERVGRYEDAAEIYEALELYDNARQLREKVLEKQVVVKKTDVVVDLNKLIHQVKDGVIVVVYRCPHCGGKLKIGKDASVESLKVCEHCGSEIEAMDLADFLRTALS